MPNVKNAAFQWYISFHLKARIKKIMLMDDKIGKISASVPGTMCIIHLLMLARALELFLDNFLVKLNTALTETKASKIELNDVYFFNSYI